MSRILVVEDSPTVLYMLADMLRKHGYDVITAIDGDEALHIARQEHPQLILLDVILPKLNGYQVCRKIKAFPETAGIPVVMITSKAQNSDRQWAMEQGADGYIVKPFDADKLAAVIEQFVPHIP